MGTELVRSIWQSTSTMIETVEAVDDLTVEISLNQPTAGLAELLAGPSADILPKALVTDDPVAFSSAPVGSGASGRSRPRSTG